LVKNSLYGMTEMLESLVKIKPEISTVVSKYNKNKPSADQVKFPSELEWDIINELLSLWSNFAARCLFAVVQASLTHDIDYAVENLSIAEAR
jgi:hypothetical protein